MECVISVGKRHLMAHHIKPYRLSALHFSYMKMVVIYASRLTFKPSRKYRTLWHNQPKGAQDVNACIMPTYSNGRMECVLSVCESSPLPSLSSVLDERGFLVGPFSIWKTPKTVSLYSVCIRSTIQYTKRNANRNHLSNDGKWPTKLFHIAAQNILSIFICLSIVHNRNNIFTFWYKVRDTSQPKWLMNVVREQMVFSDECAP